jgi:hypothetical protein
MDATLALRANTNATNAATLAVLQDLLFNRTKCVQTLCSYGHPANSMDICNVTATVRKTAS